MKLLLCSLAALCLAFSSVLSAPFEIEVQRAPSMARPGLAKWLESVSEGMNNGQGHGFQMPKKASCPFRNHEAYSQLTKEEIGGKHATGAALFSSFADTFLYGKLSVGTPAQDFNVIIDSTMFVFYGYPATFVLDASKCTKGSGSYCEKCKTFDPTKSITFEDKLDLKNNSLVSDMINFGGVQAEAEFLLLNGDQFNAFDVIYNNAPPNTLPGLDGIFSMAFTFAVEPVKSGMEYILETQQNQIAAIYLEPTSSLDFFQKQRGTITIGALNNKTCSSDWDWTPVPYARTTRWQINLETVSYGDISAKGGTAYFSTFHTFIFGPAKVVQHLLSLVTPITKNMEGREPKDVAITCDRSKLPDIKFKLGVRTYTITPAQYVMDVVIDPKDASKNICHLMIRAIPSDGAMPDIEKLVTGDNWFFGQLFLNQFCVAFDYTPHNQRIGISVHA